MNQQYEIYRWLQRAFEEHVDLINEAYYFDRRDNQFYSVFITDWLLNEDDEDVDADQYPYSKDERTLLIDRMERQEKEDANIIPVSCLTIEERKLLMQSFIDSYDHLSQHELSKVIASENGRQKLNFQNMLDDGSARDWESFKRKFFVEKADSFCNLYNIDIGKATLWTDQKMTSMTLKIEQDEPQNNQSKLVKPWWKFW